MTPTRPPSPPRKPRQRGARAVKRETGNDRLRQARAALKAERNRRCPVRRGEPTGLPPKLRELRRRMLEAPRGSVEHVDLMFEYDQALRAHKEKAI